jgi:hypothetical protein
MITTWHCRHHPTNAKARLYPLPPGVAIELGLITKNLTGTPLARWASARLVLPKPDTNRG